MNFDEYLYCLDDKRCPNFLSGAKIKRLDRLEGAINYLNSRLGELSSDKGYFFSKRIVSVGNFIACSECGNPLRHPDDVERERIENASRKKTVQILEKIKDLQEGISQKLGI